MRVRGISGPIMANGTPAYNGHLRDELRVFESDQFDANAYVQGKCQSMSEKVNPGLFSYLFFESWPKRSCLHVFF